MLMERETKECAEELLTVPEPEAGDHVVLVEGRQRVPDDADGSFVRVQGGCVEVVQASAAEAEFPCSFIHE